MKKIIQYFVWFLVLNVSACTYFPHELAYPKFIFLELALVALALIMSDI